MASPPISELRFLDSSGRPAVAAEWTPLLLELAGDAASWETLELRINGLPRPVALRRFGGSPRMVADWPPSGAGRYRVEVCAGSERQMIFLGIPCTKLGDDGLAAMLHDVDRRLPHAIAVGLQRGGGLVGVVLDTAEAETPAAELNRLREAVPDFVALLPALAANPHRILEEVTVPARLAHVRRPHPLHVRAALYRAVEVDAGRRPLALMDRRTAITVDTYENRIVRSLSDHISGRLRRLISVLRGGAGADEAAALFTAVTTVRRQASFLDTVRPLTAAPARSTMVLVRRAEYRTALGLLRELNRRQRVCLEDSQLEAPLESVPALYELWCGLRLMASLLDIAVAEGFAVIEQRVVERVPDSLFVRVPTDGKRPLLKLARDNPPGCIALYFQHHFGGGTGPGPFRSLSFGQRPDFTLSITEPGGPPRLALFDPKYKLDQPGNAPRKEDIDKMHAYRDAIVCTSTGDRPVRHAAILFPGHSRLFGDGVAAVSLNPGDSRHDDLFEFLQNVIATIRSPSVRREKMFML